MQAAELSRIGAALGQPVLIAAVEFERPGFFTGDDLAVAAQLPWSLQLPQFAADCMERHPVPRLDAASCRDWAELCAHHAPALDAVQDQACLVHADFNPKNLLVTGQGTSWQVTAVLDWEFSFSGCPYADAANMVRFADGYPAAYADGFTAAFAGHQPAGLPPPADWLYLGRVFDLFALSDLVTRPAGHGVADEAAELIRRWLASGVPGAVSS